MHRPPRLVPTALAILAALAAATLLLTACGSDDGGGGDTSEFSTALNDLCLDGKATAGRASDELTAALDALGQAAQDRDQAAYAAALEQAQTAVEGIIGAFDDFQAAVADLDVPAELQGSLDDYLDAQNTQRALAQQLRDAIATDDGAAFNDAITGIRDADQRTTEARTTAAAALDAPDCAPDATDTTGDTTGDPSSGSTGGGDTETTAAG